MQIGELLNDLDEQVMTVAAGSRDAAFFGSVSGQFESQGLLSVRSLFSPASLVLSGVAAVQQWMSTGFLRWLWECSALDNSLTVSRVMASGVQTPVLTFDYNGVVNCRAPLSALSVATPTVTTQGFEATSISAPTTGDIILKPGGVPALRLSVDSAAFAGGASFNGPVELTLGQMNNEGLVLNR